MGPGGHYMAGWYPTRLRTNNIIISRTRKDRKQLSIFCSLVVSFTGFKCENPYSREGFQLDLNTRAVAD